MARWQIQSRCPDLSVPSGIKSILLIDFWFILLSLRTQGRTIRKVMTGWGIFKLQEYFSLSNSLYEFFLGHGMNIFQGQLACMNFFSFNFPLSEFFFLYLACPPPPHQFSNAPSLTRACKWRLAIQRNLYHTTVLITVCATLTQLT